MTPSSSDLDYFLEIANLLNLSRAAECLGISQPSLSLALQRLENNIGTPLFIRHKQGVTLTKAGQQLHTHAKQMIEHWQQIKAKALASINEIQGSITIGCHPAVAMYSLNSFLADLLENHPKLGIKLSHDLSRKITEQVISLKIDIAIVINPVKHPDLIIKHLDYDKIKLWRGKGKRKIQDLTSGRAVLICDLELLQTQSILKKLKQMNITYGHIIHSDNMEVISELVVNGCGIGILPEKIARLKKITAIPNTPYYEDEICLLFRDENRNIKAIQVICNAIKQHFTKERVTV